MTSMRPIPRDINLDDFIERNNCHSEKPRKRDRQNRRT